MVFFIPGPSLTAERQGPGLIFSIENENFKPRMKISSENENFVRGGMVFFMRSSENEFFRSPGPLGKGNELSREGPNFFDNNPFAWKTPTPPSNLQTQS